ncbi:hypothetical protein HBB16_13215 [Pseudonocardia sp. MCCB 268]|nr:hypothetical protein [Pseudonocardia cytotoxica]
MGVAVWFRLARPQVAARGTTDRDAAQARLITVEVWITRRCMEDTPVLVKIHNKRSAPVFDVEVVDLHIASGARQQRRESTGRTTRLRIGRVVTPGDTFCRAAGLHRREQQGRDRPGDRPHHLHSLTLPGCDGLPGQLTHRNGFTER